MAEAQLDNFSTQFSLLQEDSNLRFTQDSSQTTEESQDFQLYKAIQRKHSIALIVYSLCTCAIFVELVILLVMYRAKGGIGGRHDFLYR